MRQTICLEVNGSPFTFGIHDGTTLLELLRQEAFTGAKQGCDLGTCGSCTVLVNGNPTLSCLTLAGTVDGTKIETIEGAGATKQGAAIQSALGACGGTQCGACTSGVIMSGLALLRQHPRPSRETIRVALSGNLCRCTGYGRIIDAIEVAAGTREMPKNAIVKIDAASRANGSALYTDDLVLPDMLIGKVLRSPHAHAKIDAIDISDAAAMKGVHTVITGSELPKRYGIIPWAADEHALAQSEVFYVGQAVAAVAAVDEETALAACRAIRVSYTPLPAVMTAEAALAPGAPLVHHVDPRKGTERRDNIFKRVELPAFGDIEAAFKNAAVVVEDTFTYPGSNHVAIETHAVIAAWTGEKLHVWSGTQVSHYLQIALAHVLEVPEENVRVTQMKKGGAFGGDSDFSELDFCAAKLSQIAGRPVKMQYTREEVFTFHRGRHETKISMRLAMGSDGSVLGVESDVVLDGGAFASFGPITVYYLLQLLGGPIKIGAYKARSQRVYTNKPPQGPKRGHGTPQPRFAFEILLDRAARRLGLDPLEVRRRGAIRAGEETVNGFRIPSSGILECLDIVARASNWANRHELPPGCALGMATGMYISGTAGAILGERDRVQSNVHMKVSGDGCLNIATQANDIGQGLEMTLALIAHEVTGIPIEKMRITTGDTARGPVDLGAYSSRGALMLGTAAYHAAVAIREGQRGGNETPEAIGSFITIPVTASGPAYAGNTIGASPSYSMTAQVALVHVDRKTGEVQVKKIWAAHDCGRPINPDAVRGQIEGSVSMGDSEARFECMTYEPDHGLLVQSNLLGHLIATSLDAPEVESFIIETEDPMSPHGAKEAGEGPLLPTAPAIANAVAEAIGGGRVSMLPLTPDRVLAVIRQHEKENSSC